MAANTTCPYCHSTNGDKSPSFHRASRDETNLIYEEVHRLEALITQLHQEKAALLRRLNSIQSASRSLPLETLSLIFQYAVLPSPGGEEKEGMLMSTVFAPPHRNRYFQLVLGSVSARWRDVVYSTPQLWAQLSFAITPESLERHSSFMALALGRSGRIPLSLDFSFPRYLDFPPDSTFTNPHTDELLSDHLSRVKELRLINPSQRWFTTVPQLSQITKLTVGFDAARNGLELWLTGLVSLRYLALTRVLGRVQLPSGSLVTRLKLENIPIDTCVQLFFQCPKLSVFAALPSECVDDSHPQTMHPMAFQDLEVFEWGRTTYPGTWNQALLQYAHLPILGFFGWDNKAFLDLDLDFISFLERLPSTLRVLKLRSYTEDFFIDLIPETLPIEHLVLDACESAFIFELMDKLARTGEPKMFPRLRKLTLRNRGSWTSVSGIIGSVAEMLESRLEEADDFYLEVISSGVELSSDAVEKLRGMEPRLTMRVI